MKESYSYRKLKEGKVQCLTCSHKCLISSDGFGVCGVRKNVGGVLYVLNYGKVFSYGVDPIEKKPFFHFLPNSSAFSFCLVGCNLRCANCQNWQISQGPKMDKKILEIGEEISPKELVQKAIDSNCKSIAYTYTEPTIFLEYALDVMKVAKEAGLKNVWVSNGFMTKEVVDLIIPYLDAINIDIKSFEEKFYKKQCGAKIGPVLENCKLLKNSGVHLEITSLVIPGFSDSEHSLINIAKFISEELGTETPWHVTAFSGKVSWKMKNVQNTPAEKIHKAYEIGKNAGLKYVYAGNLAGDPEESTYCPSCNEICIRRVGYFVENFDNYGKCPKCGEDLNIIK